MEILVSMAASSVLITMVLIIRIVFEKKVPPSLLYFLWLPVALRLLLPGMVTESPISMMNTGIWNAGSGFLVYNAFSKGLWEEREEGERKAQAGVLGNEIKASSSMEMIGEAEGEIKGTKQEKTNDTGLEGQLAAGVITNMGTDTIELKRHPAATFLGKLYETAVVVRLSGIGVFALTFLWKNLSFYGYLRATRKKWKVVNAGRRRISVFTAGNQLNSPCLFGLFPAVYIPKEAVAFQDKEEELTAYILEHELTHYRHGDHVWAFVRMLCLILNWYNPLVWIAARLSVRDGELACDAGCIKRMGEDRRYDYGEALITMIRPTCKKEQLFPYAAMITIGKKFMKKRMDYIAQKRKNSGLAAAIMLSLSFLCAGCTFTGFSGEKKTEAADNTAATQTFSEVNLTAKYGGKAVVLKGGGSAQDLNGNLESKIFILTPVPYADHGDERMNVLLPASELYLPDLEGNYAKLGELCENATEDEILQILNRDFDLQLSEAEIWDYESFICRIDEAGGLTVYVEEAEKEQINSSRLMRNSQAETLEDRLVESGEQTLNGIQAAAYLQIGIGDLPSGYYGMQRRWEQVAAGLLEKEGTKILDSYEEFFAGNERVMYIEGEEGAYLLCFCWEEEIERIHETLFPDMSYEVSDFLKEADGEMKELAKQAASDIRTDVNKLWFHYSLYMGKSPFMISLFTGKEPESETEDAWQTVDVTVSGERLALEEEKGRAVYAMNLVFENSGVTRFPEKGSGGISAHRFLYLTKKDDGWYADGPLHNQLPPEEWWQGKEVQWEVYDFGFSDEDALGTVTKTQSEYDAFMQEVREEMQKREG